MDATEVKLECLKLAVAQASREHPEKFLDRVAEIQSRFYTLISGTPDPDPQPDQEKGRRGRPRTDKAAPIFE